MIIDGKEVAKNIIEELKEKVSELNIKPTLAIVRVGNDEASKIYVKNKMDKAQYIGYNIIYKLFSSTITRQEFIIEINNLIKQNPTGIIIQLPLPENLQGLIDLIPSEMDVDGLTSYNLGKVMIGEPNIIPCTPKGIIRLLKIYNIDLVGKTILVIGKSNLVGKPMGALVLKEGATLIQAHSKTTNLNELLGISDIIISATGCPHLVKGEFIKQNSVIVDVGITRENGKIVGDVDFSCYDKCSYITPVPGGVGPMTVAMLMENLYELNTKFS